MDYGCQLNGFFLFFLMLSIMSSQLCGPTTALKCHDCTSWEGGTINFKPGCDSHPDTGVMKDGFTGCLEVWGYMGDMSRALVVRGGYFNKQVEGRVPSCYHPNQLLIVEVHVEIVRFDFITYCHVCDDLDGCNGALNWRMAKILLTFSTILVLLLA